MGMHEAGLVFDSDLLAGFNGLSFMPKIWAMGSNSLKPVLRLYGDRIEYCGSFRLKKCDYANIEKVDVLTIPFTKSVVLYFNHTPRTFSGNFRRDQDRVACLRSFLAKECQLTEEALVIAGVLRA